MTRRYVSIALLSIVGFVGTAIAGPAPKVQICHIPPGNPANFHTIVVSASAVASHLAHGDIGGACNSVCAILCNDGNACTVDDAGNCQERGCPTAPPLVDCNDGALCTEDSCNPASGCVNTPRQCPAPNNCTISQCAPGTGDCVNFPVVCPDGYSCNPGNGECESDDPGDPCEGVVCDPGTTCVPDADPLCAPIGCLTDWACGDPINICGGTPDPVGLDSCLCDLSVEGSSFCWNNIACSQAPTCQNTSDCPAGWTCASSCCGTACLPPCGYQDGGLKNQKEGSGVTAAGK